jgi:hypothetical protein
VLEVSDTTETMSKHPENGSYGLQVCQLSTNASTSKDTHFTNTFFPATNSLRYGHSRPETGWTPNMKKQTTGNEGVFDDERNSGQAANGKISAVSFDHNHPVLKTVSFLP